MIYRLEGKGFWLDEAVDAFLSYLGRRGTPKDAVITVAAGMTPSCPIHFGIFREVMISHFVAEELARRGYSARLVFYWDDYDHFCKVPYFTTKDEIKDFVGKPLCEVPDPDGEFASYGEHYMRLFEDGLERLGVRPVYDYQRLKYSSGAYREYLRKAVRARKDIFDIINGDKAPYDAMISGEREAYFPLEVYCAACRRDAVTVSGYAEAGDEIEYECRACRHRGSYSLGGDFRGKLVWKANWAARWRDDTVLFESCGENQLTQTGSYAVSSRIVSDIFGGEAPFSLLYRFIGAPGIAKVSRAMGEKSLSARLTDLVEPAVVRWLMLKNPADKPFTIDLEGSLERIYGEWDAFAAKAAAAPPDSVERRMLDLATKGLPTCRIPVSFKSILVSIGVANGDGFKAASLLKKISKFQGSAEELLEKAGPRIQCARKYVFKYGNRQDAPILLKEMDADAYRDLSRECREAIRALAAGLPSCATEEDLAELVKRAPESVAGAAGVKGGYEELRREFYRGLYALLIGRERGPKLSTLMHLAGNATVLKLIKGEAIYEQVKYRVG